VARAPHEERSDEPQIEKRHQDRGREKIAEGADRRVQIGAPRSGAGGQALPFSPAIRAGDFVYVSGQVAHDENGELVDGGIIKQTRQTIENLRRILEKAGCTLDDVIKCNVWLADARDFWSFNKVYASHFPGVPPARSTVQSPLMIDAKIEIDCVAYRPL
jgi:reactive intermediate/imine deaminase